MLVIADPRGPERDRQPAVRRTPGGDEHLAVPGLQYGKRQMRGRPEPEQADAVACFHARHPQAAEADDPGAEQRSRLKIVQGAGKRKHEIAASQRVFRIAAVYRVPGEGGRVAQILMAAPAIAALPVRSA